MMIVLLLLGASVCTGLSFDGYAEEEYGNTHRMRLHRKTQFIKFIPKYNSEMTTVWNRDDPPASEDSRRKVMGIYYVIDDLTQRDSGHYIMSDKDHNKLSTKTIEVIANRRSFSLKPGQHLSFTFNLEPNSCNIYFFPEREDKQRKSKTEIVREGRLQESWDESDCAGFYLLKPCGISKKVLKMSCGGRFEVRDQNDDEALVVSLDMEPLRSEPSYLVIAIGAFSAAFFCCCCVRRCCCGNSSSKTDSDETAAAEPAAGYHEYDRPPVSPRPKQCSRPSGANYPAHPLIHKPPATKVPPAYSEAPGAARQADAPTVPLNSDPEPQFELKGVTFPSASPLTSDSTYCDVYTSDKLSSI